MGMEELLAQASAFREDGDLLGRTGKGTRSVQGQANPAVKIKHTAAGEFAR
jgi:hypothetical protein